MKPIVGCKRKENKMKMLISFIFMSILGSAMADENIGKVYDPCKKWIYFSDEDINWKYSNGLNINGDFYDNWQILLFSKIPQSKQENVSNRIEELTKAMIETNRILLDCKN